MKLRRSTIILSLLGVFIVALGMFLWLQSGIFFADPDSFYHIKIAQLISQQGPVTAFPWLAFTGLPTYFTDQHFLYHVFLVPFVTLLHPVAGAKIATALLNAVLITLFAGFLIRFRVRWWPAYVAILLVTNPFLFRINLVKAPGLSIILLLLGLWFLFTRRPWPLAALAFLYVWTYGGFSLLGIFALVYVVVASYGEWRNRRFVLSVFRRFSSHRWNVGKLLRHRLTQLLLAVLLGLVAGLLINPYFPQNLFFYWQQLVQIGIVNFQNVVNVGGEWRPYGFVELLANTVFVSIAVLLALVLSVLYRRRQTMESWTLLILAAFFFLITLKSRRYVELYVPFATLYAAFATRDALLTVPTSRLWARVRKLFQERSTVAIILTVYFVASSFTVITRDMRQLDHDLKSGFRENYLSGVSQWLTANSPQGSIVVHSDWDDFPSMFYHNSHNNYIVGLDPTFMYQYNKALYVRWADLTMGKRTSDATPIITQDLKSSIVVVTKDHPAFRTTMDQQQGFSVVYEDDEAAIYQLEPSRAP